MYGKDEQTQLDLLVSTKFLPNIFDKGSQYRRGKCDKVFTGLLAFIKDVGCDKHALPFAMPAKQTKIH